jgi:hypothetical protein
MDQLKRFSYHLLLDKISANMQQTLLNDPAVMKLYVSPTSGFRHGQTVPDLLINGKWLSDSTTANRQPPSNPNAVIVRSDWPELSWLLLQTQGL